MGITKQELREDRARLGRMVLGLRSRVAELEAGLAKKPDYQGIGDGDIRFALAGRDRYREALERIEAHWNGVDGEISPTLMANIAIDALHP